MTTIHNYQNDDFDPDEMFNYSASYDESTTEYVYDEYVYDDEGDKKSSEHTHQLPKVDRKLICCSKVLFFFRFSKKKCFQKFVQIYFSLKKTLFRRSVYTPANRKEISL